MSLAAVRRKRGYLLSYHRLLHGIAAALRRADHGGSDGMLVETGAGAARSGAVLNVNLGLQREKLPLLQCRRVLGCTGQRDKPSGTPLRKDNETLRWPTNLDQKGIVERLVEVRAMAEAAGLPEVAARFSGVESMHSGEIGANVIGALTLLQEKPEYEELLLQLSMVAMNLKNLK